jgi:anaerobic ribonucleoside-triphosphate reductase activating protein
MKYAKMRAMDINNGPGICATLFVQGCNRHCSGCFNPETWDFNGGQVWNRRCHTQFVEECKKEHIKNVCILGGEPLEQDIQLIELLKDIKKETNKSIWLWTGYQFEDIYKPEGTISTQQFDSEKYIKQSILQYVDILVDGPYVEELADKNLKYRGSSNQRILLLQESIKRSIPILAEEYYQEVI